MKGMPKWQRSERATARKSFNTYAKMAEVGGAPKWQRGMPKWQRGMPKWQRSHLLFKYTELYNQIL